MKTIIVDGIEYIPKSEAKTTKLQLAKPKGKMPYVLVRTYSAGVFVGYLKSRKDKEVVLLNARRIWYWEGASSLSQLAMEGTTKPDKCKFPCEVAEITLTEAIEIIQVTETAKKSIAGVPIWEQK